LAYSVRRRLRGNARFYIKINREKAGWREWKEEQKKKS
jgi:hypothetical protein